MPSWEEEWARQQREAREKRERADLEYEREEAQRTAELALRGERAAREWANRDRAAAAEELEYAREAEANAEAEAREVKRRADELERLLRAIVAAWDCVLPDGRTNATTEPPMLGPAIDSARAYLNPVPPMPNEFGTDSESTD